MYRLIWHGSLKSFRENKLVLDFVNSAMYKVQSQSSRKTSGLKTLVSEILEGLLKIFTIFVALWRKYLKSSW